MAAADVTSLQLKYASPSVIEFAAYADHYLGEHGPASVNDLRDTFGQLCRSPDTITAPVNAHLQRILDNPCYYGNESDEATDGLTMKVWSGRHFDLQVVPSHTGIFWYNHATPKVASGPIANFSANALLAFPQTQGLELEWYKLAEGASFDRFDKTLRIERDGTEQIGQNDVVFVEAERRMLKYALSKDNSCVMLTTAQTVMQIVSFDPRSLHKMGATLASNQHSQLCSMLDLLRRSPADTSSEGLTRVARTHTNHQVRWAATRALWRHDPAGAVNLMHILATQDPHVFVRRAARAGLSMAGSNNDKV